tara:strand:- start:283 stop:600 length:318 start_codon:yes stop_codon:yes gene_type:complete
VLKVPEDAAHDTLYNGGKVAGDVAPFSDTLGRLAREHISNIPSKAHMAAFVEQIGLAFVQFVPITMFRDLEAISSLTNFIFQSRFPLRDAAHAWPDDEDPFAGDV